MPESSRVIGNFEFLWNIISMSSHRCVFVTRELIFEFVRDVKTLGRVIGIFECLWNISMDVQTCKLRELIFGWDDSRICLRR